MHSSGESEVHEEQQVAKTKRGNSLKSPVRQTTWHHCHIIVKKPRQPSALEVHWLRNVFFPWFHASLWLDLLLWRAGHILLPSYWLAFPTWLTECLFFSLQQGFISPLCDLESEGWDSGLASATRQFMLSWSLTRLWLDFWGLLIMIGVLSHTLGLGHWDQSLPVYLWCELGSKGA